MHKKNNGHVFTKQGGFVVLLVSHIRRTLKLILPNIMLRGYNVSSNSSNVVIIAIIFHVKCDNKHEIWLYVTFTL